MLTDVAIENLKAQSARKEYPDGKIGGLYLVVQPSGAKSFALRYRVAGVPRKFTIGPYPAINLKTARKRAQEALGDVAGGEDPAGAKRAALEAQKAALAAADRVEDVVGAFVTLHLGATAKPSWAKEAERLLRVEVIPKFGKKRLGEITGDGVHNLLRDIAKRGAPITANRTFSVFRKMCNWAMSRDGGRLIKTSPCAGVDAPSAEHSRERTLDDAEIKLAWGAFESIGWPFGPIGKLLLLTGARRNEVASMEWRELDLAAAVWKLPRERTKNKRAHEVPLSDAAVEIIKALPRVEGKAGLVFSTTGRTAVSAFSRAKTAIDAAIVEGLRKDADASDDQEIKAPDWVVHDLRRTVATNLQKLGVRLEVTEAVLNHKSGTIRGVAAIYNRFAYEPEKRAALDAWARRLDAIVSGAPAGNVVEFAGRR